MPDLDWTGYKQQALADKDNDPDPLDVLINNLKEELKNSDFQYNEKIIDFLVCDKDEFLQELVKESIMGSWQSRNRILEYACLLHLWDQRKG